MTRPKDTPIEFVPKRTIKTTQEDIDTGTPRCTKDCALVRTFENVGATRVLIHKGKVRYTLNGRRYYFDATPAIQQFIALYDGPDGKKRVQPTTFTLRNGYSIPSGRTGAPDKTEKHRHRPGGRAARKGYAGKRTFQITTQRSDGMAVYKLAK